MSAIGKFNQQLGILSTISSVRSLARTFVSLQDFLPRGLGDGRVIATHTLLGPAFSLALLTGRI